MSEAVEWITETVGCLFPVEWDAFRTASGAVPGQRLVDDYYEMLTGPDDRIRAWAVDAWMAWEDAHVSLGQTHSAGEHDPLWRQTFVVLTAHYWKHAAFLPASALRDGMSALTGIPAVLIQGKLDVSGPAAVAWNLHKAWPGSRFVLIEDEGHGGPKMVQAMVQAIAEFGDKR
ncbi:alpha/beta fold hydrolase [Nocardia tengchongensis]